MRKAMIGRFEWTPPVATNGRTFPTMWIAALVHMLPVVIRDVARQSLDAHSSCRGFRGKVRNLLAKCACLEDTGPSPMYIGVVQGECDQGGPNNLHIGAAGKGSRACWACGEQSHFSRECAKKADKKSTRKGRLGHRRHLECRVRRRRLRPRHGAEPARAACRVAGGGGGVFGDGGVAAGRAPESHAAPECQCRFVRYGTRGVHR